MSHETIPSYTYLLSNLVISNNYSCAWRVLNLPGFIDNQMDPVTDWTLKGHNAGYCKPPGTLPNWLRGALWDALLRDCWGPISLTDSKGIFLRALEIYQDHEDLKLSLSQGRMVQ